MEVENPSMSVNSSAIAEAAESLPAEERIKLVERLLESLDKADPEIDRAWADESERRLDDYFAGNAETRPAADVLARHLKP